MFIDMGGNEHERTERFNVTDQMRGQYTMPAAPLCEIDGETYSVSGQHITHSHRWHGHSDLILFPVLTKRRMEVLTKKQEINK